MYGNDIERLLKAIDVIYINAQNALVNMATTLDRRLVTEVDGEPLSTASNGPHAHPPDGSHSHTLMPHHHFEKTVSASKMQIDASIFLEEMKKLQMIRGKLYTSTDQLNNSVGSPYSELSNLLEQLTIYGGAANSPVFIGQHASLGLLAGNIVYAAINAKFAVIQYHDGVQRGYDACCNGGKSSITWDSFNDGKTDGNIK